MEFKDDSTRVLQWENNYKPVVKNKKKKIAFIVPGLFLLLGFIFLIVGIALMLKFPKPCTRDPKVEKQSMACEYSEEAKKIGLDKFLRKVQSTYYKLHPEYTVWHPRATSDKIRKEYKAYDPSPEALKKRTDIAMELLKEIKGKKVNFQLLTSRELNAFIGVEHYLKYVFGFPYHANYYSADWMLGPDMLCWQPICMLESTISANLLHMLPRNVDEIQSVLNHLSDIKKTVSQYQRNMKLGVKTGMVRTRKDCLSGLSALRQRWSDVDQHGPSGITKTFALFLGKFFLQKLPETAREEWRNKTGSSVNESVAEVMIRDVGTPIYNLIRYLETEHYSHCRPDTGLAGGLSALPVDYIYINGTANKSSKTTKFLPIKDINGKYQLINGTNVYRLTIDYFTTTNLSVEEIYDLGQKRLKTLYSQAIKVAKLVTQTDNETMAEEAFKKKLLTLKESYFNAEKLPINESGTVAFKICNTIEKAKKNCPNRWKATEKRFNFIRQIIGKLPPKTTDMFYFTGVKRTTPNCPIELKPDFNPIMGAQSYLVTDGECTHNAGYLVPFFQDNIGPVYSEYSICAHEGIPGHHTQFQSRAEYFTEKCSGPAKWLQEQNYYNAFSEGWGLYAEHPLIGEDTDVYNDIPMQKYGMLKLQIWRALRLIVDTGMHAKKMTRAEALEYHAKYAWDSTDIAEKEITRYQSSPGQALGYMLGQQKIVDLRKYCEKELGDEFSLKEFHYQVLRQGNLHLKALEQHIKRFVTCKKTPGELNCKSILNPNPVVLDESVKTETGQYLNLHMPQRRYYL